MNVTTDSGDKFFQSTQISEYDIATILLLKALKFEVNKEEEKKKRTRDEDNLDEMEENEEVDFLDEPCKVLWKINFDRETMISMFLVSYKDNNKERLRLWIKGHPFKVLECCK